jgi:hypothetical protein
MKSELLLFLLCISSVNATKRGKLWSNKVKACLERKQPEGKAFTIYLAADIPGISVIT